MDELSFYSGFDPGDYPSRKVAVAMSGGVDSSLAAYVLKEAGFDVIGVTMVLIDSDDGTNAAARDAGIVAAEIGIPHYTVDLRSQFEQEIVRRFVSTYIAGRTPNPCVLCNRAIKWGALRDYAWSLGYDLFATGHYARIARHADGSLSLLTGIDREKDQSYFLWALDSGSLSRTLFPLGATTKAENRARAQSIGLKTAERAESQEICFIPGNDYREFLRRRFHGEVPRSMTEGNIMDMMGNVVGTHQGTAFYTIGQRRGLGVAAGRPIYVIMMDADSNTVFIGTKDDLMSSFMKVVNLNWIGGHPPAGAFGCSTRIRYRHPGALSEVIVTGDSAMVSFDEPQSAVTPGQSAVFYDGECVIGGGIIEFRSLTH